MTVPSAPTAHDRETAHQVVREWYKATPAMEAQLRTVGAQRGLEERIAEAIVAARVEGYRVGYIDADNGKDAQIPGLD